MDNDTEKAYEILMNTREMDMQRISSLDSTIFTIKGWAVTLIIALIGLAIQQQTRTFLYLGIGATLLFAAFDAFYRQVQLGHVERVDKIEKYLKVEYLREVEGLKQISKLFDAQSKRNFNRDYLIPVFLVYCIILLVLLCLVFIFPILFATSR